MDNKYLRFIILITVIPFLLCGCWDSNELNEVSFCYSLSIDKKDENYVVYAQLLRTTSNKTEKGILKIVSSEGNTITKAIRNFQKSNPYKINYSNCYVIIIGDIIAREGIADLLDLLARIYQVRFDAFLVVAKDTPAYRILENSELANLNQSQQLYQTMKNSISCGIGYRSTIMDAIYKYSQNGIDPVLGVMSLRQGSSVDEKDKKGIEYSGLAIFKDEKMVGWLPEDKTLDFNWLVGKVEKSFITVHFNNVQSNMIFIDVKKTSSRMKIYEEGDKVKVDIIIDVVGNISNERGGIDIAEYKNFMKVQEKAKETIEKELRSLINRQYLEMNEVDFLGVEDAIYKQNNKLFEKMKKRTSKPLVSEVKCTPIVNLKLEKTGMIQKPLKH